MNLLFTISKWIDNISTAEETKNIDILSHFSINRGGVEMNKKWYYLDMRDMISLLKMMKMNRYIGQERNKKRTLYLLALSSEPELLSSCTMALFVAQVERFQTAAPYSSLSSFSFPFLSTEKQVFDVWWEMQETLVHAQKHLTPTSITLNWQVLGAAE